MQSPAIYFSEGYLCIYEKTEKGISMRNKYHNYDPHPVKKIEGHNSEIWENYDSAAEELRKEAEKRKKQGRVLVVFDYTRA